MMVVSVRLYTAWGNESQAVLYYLMTDSLKRNAISLFV